MVNGNTKDEKMQTLEHENTDTFAVEVGGSQNHTTGSNVRGTHLPSRVTMVYGVAGSGKTSALRSIVSNLPHEATALVVTEHMEEWDDVGGDCAIAFCPLTVRGKCSVPYAIRSRADVIIVDEPLKDAYEWVKTALGSGHNLAFTLHSGNEEQARRVLTMLADREEVNDDVPYDGWDEELSFVSVEDVKW